MDWENIHGILSIVWYFRKEQQRRWSVQETLWIFIFEEEIDLLDTTLLQFIQK